MCIGKDLNDYINELEGKRIKSFYAIPEEYRNIPEIICLERELGLRKLDKRGYDVIQGSFFVDEIVLDENYEQELIEESITNSFADFESYYEFLSGDIYDKACYFQYNFTDEIIKKFRIDKDKLNMQSSISKTIDDYLPEASEEEKEKYDEVEAQMALRKKWIKKYNACATYDELIATNRKHKNSKDDTNELFYFWNYINYHGKKCYEIMMRFISLGQYPAFMLERASCFLFGPERALKAYDYKAGVTSTNKKHNANFKKFVEDVLNRGVDTKILKFFDKNTHYYCVKTELYLKGNSLRRPIAELYNYFETFEEFAEYLENDISDCDLSSALSLKVDLYKYKFNDATKFPIGSYTDLKKVVSKRYDRYGMQFEVIIKWYNSDDIMVCEKKEKFRFFFDFIAFLKNDLSDADLLFCDGLSNLLDFSNIKFTDAKLRSSICERIGMVFNKSSILNNQEKEFAVSEANEKETALILKDDRIELREYECVIDDRRIFYITDLHLIHRIRHANCITEEDCLYVIQSIVDRFFDNEVKSGSIILIGGDIASEFFLFSLFVNLLRRTMDERRRNAIVIFTLGNHELWGFQGESLDAIVEKYRDLLTLNRMYLLQNEVIYQEDGGSISSISSRELINLSDLDIRTKLRRARVIMFGGIGFSGYNQDFNANNGIYRKTLSREQEIKESKICEALYNRICSCLSDKKVIIFTHMPFADWYINDEKVDNFTYVSGHNHRNAFYDDGVIRIYSDNQVGYHSENPILKYFYIDNKYDCFSDYEDGIYQITRGDYIDFHRGKNLPVTFNRKINELYMLKKADYYCFIHKNVSGGLTILNGGSLKALESKDIEYYYENMDAEIAFIKSPLGNFQAIQKKVSDSIKAIGGSGHIHGAIVDIDFYNHIYVNPNDLTITPYLAMDMIEKYVYSSVPALLEANCPMLYANYNKALAGESKKVVAIRGSGGNELATKPKLYLSTDIYAASRELKKMQKLNSNILSAWYDNIPGIKLLPQKERVIHTAVGESKIMNCGMRATIVAYANYDDISVQFDDGTLIEHISKNRFTRGTILNPNITEKVITHSQYTKNSYVGRTNMMKCGMNATVIEDLGCKDITVQFEDGLIRKHRRRDHFDLGKIAHIPDLNG